MFTFLLVVHAIIAAALVGVILVQRSEGGGLGMGGSPTGLMSARGAADFLTRATTVLATLFVLMSIGLAVLASVQRGPRVIDTSLARTPGAAAGLAPAAPAGNGVPLADPLAGGALGNAVAPLPTLAPAADGSAPATTRRQRTQRSSAAENATAPSTEKAVAPPAEPAAAPAPAVAEPATTPAPAPPANSSPGTTNANGATPQ